MPLHAALGPKVQLKSKLLVKQQLISVTVPDGYSNVSVEVFQKDSSWKSIASAKAQTGVMNFKLPKYAKKVRAVGRKWMKDQSVGSRSKFPAKFYKGKNSFDAIDGSTGGDFRLMSNRVVAMASSTTLDSNNSSAGASQLPEEADIWKIDGSTVYFFNQLRGLQVLDMSNPADPRLTASLRMPELGQDLYVIRESDGSRRLVLLTQDWSPDGVQTTRISLVKFNGTMPEVTHQQEIPGGLSDSRLVGDRLILVTSEWKSTSGRWDGNWTSESRISEWILKPGEAPLADGETVIVGANPLIAAGADWLAVSVHPQGDWNKSEVSVFAIKPTGLESMGAPIRTEGAISSKFAISWSNNVLTTVSHKGRWSNESVSVLENFRAWNPDVVHPMVVEDRLGVLELAKGENLYATRFAGDRVYVVTFLQTDPLWVVDLKDPANPNVSGHLEVPGFSTYLQPVGNYLFSVGLESGIVAASLFDVTDPTNPGLVKRLNLGNSYSYSEAVWDEKAVKVLLDAGLVMIPVSSPDPSDGKWKSTVQLLDLDAANGVLSARGVIAHEFEARRSEMVGDALVSISQRELIAADIADRDAPSILSEVSLAWPVDRCLEVGNHLIQIEDGNWNWYSEDHATARISPNDNTEAIYAEVDLGAGRVKIAERRGNNLYVLRDKSASHSWGYYRIAYWPSGGSDELVLDIYDVSNLPSMTLVGSLAVPSGNSGSQLSSTRFLWPRENRPAIFIEPGFSHWYGWWPMPVTVRLDDAAVKASSQMLSDKPSWISDAKPQMIVFDVSAPSAPSAGKAIDFASEGSRPNGASEAANGLVVTGVSHYDNPVTKIWLQNNSTYQSAQVIDVPNSGDPIMRPLIDLPGKLVAVSELDDKGFLAFTTGNNAGELQVSASDGYDAFLVSTLKIPAYAPCAVDGRRVYVAFGNSLLRNSLANDGSFVAEATLDVGWTAYSLKAVNGTIVGSGGTSILATKSGFNDIKTWQFPTWSVYADRVEMAADGDLLVPLGQYGMERLER